MHTYLRSIGFSQLKKQTDVDELIKNVIKISDEKHSIRKKNGMCYVEIKMRVSESCGIIVRGEEDPDGEFHYSHFIPYSIGTEWTTEPEIYFNKRVDTDAFTGMCDDVNMGVTIIFCVTNIVDYFFIHGGKKKVADIDVRFSGLATEGKILLPTQMHVMEKSFVKQQTDKRAKSSLLEAAKNGDPDAITDLSLADIDNYAMISERIKKEDVLSIVDTSFYPFGSESDIYNVIGNIEKVSEETNKCTGEEMWNLLVETNLVYINILINKKDLLGMPEVGLRFKGAIWMQGELEHVYVDETGNSSTEK